jgi:hypothetical protein
VSRTPLTTYSAVPVEKRREWMFWTAACAVELGILYLFHRISVR